MTAPTLILPRSAALAHTWIDKAPEGTRIRFLKPGRTIPQNDKMWAMLTDVANQASHNGRKHSPEEWKCLFMQACGHEAKFLPGLSGDFFPVGFRSSKMSKEQMSELIEFIAAWGAEHGVRFQDE